MCIQTVAVFRLGGVLTSTTTSDHMTATRKAAGWRVDSAGSRPRRFVGPLAPPQSPRDPVMREQQPRFAAPHSPRRRRRLCISINIWHHLMLRHIPT